MSKQVFLESLLKGLNEHGKWTSRVPLEKPVKPKKNLAWKKLSPAQKKKAEAMKKSAFIDALLKGIHPIGNTSSGKLVLPGDPESHSGGFDDVDHLEAKKLHEAKAAKHEKKTKNLMLKPGAKFDHKAIAHAQENSAKQREKAEWHGGQVGQEAKPKIPQHEPQKLPGDFEKSKEIPKKNQSLEAQNKERCVHDLKQMDGQDDASACKICKVAVKKAFIDKISIPKKEFVDEHKKLVSVLESPSKKDDKKEAKEQGAELNEVLKKKQGVPAGVNPEKHERCVKEVKAQGHDKSSAFAICNSSMKKSFLEKLFKGGQGSGRHKNMTSQDHVKASEDHARQAGEAKTQGNVEAYESHLVESEKHKMYAKDKELPASATGAPMKKSFLDSLLKAGRTGEGSRGGKIIGHTKSGDPIYEGSKKEGAGQAPAKKPEAPASKEAKQEAPKGEEKRLPFPGEEAHKLGDIAKPAQTHTPAGGWAQHYTDYEVSPAHGELSPIGQYKHFVRNLKMMGKDWHGHVTFDPETKEIKPLTSEGNKHIKHAKENLHMLEDRAKWTPQQRKA